MSDVPFPESLCHRCAAPPRYVRAARSTFIMCPVLDDKYPRQPVLSCPLFRPPILTTERLWLRETTPADPLLVTPKLWLAVERASGVPVGQIGLLAQTIDGIVEAEVSYHLHPQHRRRGFAVEGARAVRDFAFARGDDHVIALIREENVASQAVARKLGMTPRGHATHAGLEHVVWRIDR